ncbi:glycosyltransferase [Streptomyces sp. NPDC051636]|uniref:glycosyltransferase n=1 Tax=Streptomyces sp. NPDC051636 TaxID=3365663 RepID=UPI0037921B4B
MRVLLSTHGSRGDVEPLVALAVRLRELGTEARVCAPPDEDFAQRPAGVGVPLVPVGQSARALTTGVPPPSSANLSQRAAEVIAGQFDAVTAAAEGCDTLVATGMTTTESLSAALKTTLTPETRARARAVAGTVRTDGASVAAKLLLDAVG